MKRGNPNAIVRNPQESEPEGSKEVKVQKKRRLDLWERKPSIPWAGRFM
ncbi:hypothetical protein GCM10011571_05510 [Marinithermofilum abyssi]|uniref:Uncharacterized protein n=1 Tax=Marinithermofilum abyssi TaxID=1571185 RepID=A0A8J2VBL3_9BACL|nr:hypothetical protein GCM10011571_05510 [Marinithermofilum abyssi]